jgi:prophage regulatory protein
MTDDVLRRKQVTKETGLGRSMIYALMAQEKFPRPIKISKRAVGWLASEVAAFKIARIAERDQKAGK